jgi:hypothetical protein
MRVFCPVLLSSWCSLYLYLTADNLTLSVESSGCSPSRQASLTHRQPGRRRFYLSNAYACLLLFTLHVSHCCSLNFISWVFWVPTCAGQASLMHLQSGRMRFLSCTDSQAGGDFTCVVRMRGDCAPFVPFCSPLTVLRYLSLYTFQFLPSLF